MPGIFGAIGTSPDVCESLGQTFATAWEQEQCQSVAIGGGVLGGHAFSPHAAVHSYGSGYFAVDGEFAIYEAAQTSSQGHGQLFRREGDEITLGSDSKGNLAVIDTTSGLWYLACDWAGTFPLYYVHDRGALLFCSRLRPLAHIMKTDLDPVGVVQLLINWYTFGERNVYRRIRRLLPGQILTYRSNTGQMQIKETSLAWAEMPIHYSRPVDDLVEEVQQTLIEAVRRCCCRSAQQHALMTSAGWDSRTLFALLFELFGPTRFLAYSFGDQGSRELRLVRALCQSFGVKLIQESFGNNIYDPHLLKRGFSRVENVLFPAWHRAAVVLTGAGVDCVSAGTYGEVLGGHYGSPSTLGNMRKILSTAKWLARGRLGSNTGFETMEDVYDLFRIRSLERPYYVARSFWMDIPDLVDSINSDIEWSLRRLVARGVPLGERLVEAFIAEHRGVFINTQALSCRAGLDVALPYADRDVLSLASRIPLGLKINNSLNRLVLLTTSPHSLRTATAATLVSAGAPIVLQEASRLVRWAYDTSRQRLHMVTKGRVTPSRTSHLHYEYLRDGRALNWLTDDLTAEIWDIDAIRGRIAGLAQVDWDFSARWVSSHVQGIYNTELLLQ